jgi:hypothetical protein
MASDRSRSRSAKRTEGTKTKKRYQEIVLDCPPGFPRPDDLLPAALEGTSLQIKPAVSKIFGAWTWDYSDVPENEYKTNLMKLKANITRLFRQGEIRYGSW